MALKVSVGQENFDDVRREGSYYADKTELLYELVHDKDSKVTLFTRPRRFGKTLTMSMIESFFDIARDSRDVFKGLSVTGHGEFCDEWMNQYPVLSVSFKDVEGADFEGAFIILQSTIADLCKRLAFLAADDRPDPDDKDMFLALKAQKVGPAAIKSSFKTLMRMLNSVYEKPVILLIDEYDVPLAKAGENGYYRQMFDVIRGMLSIGLKTNEYLKFAVITGCLRIAKESIFTGVNNFMSYSVLDYEFSQYFGFTREEVGELLKMADRTESSELIEAWYDGYIFGGSRVYCPWDVVNYVSSLLKRKDARPKNYWKNTSSNSVIRTFIEKKEFDVSGKFETLLNGGTITEAITDELTCDRLYESESNLWSVLLMTGYLTKKDGEEISGVAGLQIPNAEIASIFQETVANYFTKTLDQDRLQVLMEGLWKGDADAASKVMSDLLWNTISYNDYHENYYHAFLAGLFVGRGYEVESNKERGLGRPDILLKDKQNRRAIIIEAKRSGKQSEMETDCKIGIRQIIDQKYAEKLTGYEKILCYSVAFFQKSALIRKM